MSETVELQNSADIAIRPVNLSDSSLLLKWRNHPDVRRWSRNVNEIGADAHENWFKSWISKQPQNGFLFVIEILNTPVGMIRFDLKNDKSLEISILVEPSFQGKGIAKAAINASIGEIRVYFPEFTVTASIHKKNSPSIKLFKKLGFEESGKSGDFLEFFREFLFEDF